MKGRAFLALLLAITLLSPVLGSDAWAQEGSGEQEQEQEEGQRQEATNIEEVVVVTASRTEQLLLEAPTAISVIDSADIALSPATNYADLLRGVPGLNVVQTSARDINMSTRSATSTLDASQLVLVDGRSVYQDFFGFVMWDLLPVQFSEIDRIEVIRGPASAVWGANAMNGVVNVITKSPYASGNAFGVRAGGGERATGFGSILWTGARNQLGFRLSAGYYTQDPWDRPGPLPSGQPRDLFRNSGTKQPKFDGRMDYNVNDNTWWSLSAGYAGTSGTVHTGIGPFTVDPASRFWYVRGDYNWKQLNARVFVNALDGAGINLLNGLLFDFDSNTYDFSATNTTPFSTHAVTYGANLRTVNFDLSIAPLEDQRSEGGGFAQFDLNFGRYFSADAGVRVDKFSNIDNVVTSPRAALLLRPAGTPNHVVRAGYGRAFRAPSLINNFLDVTIFNAVFIPGVPPLGIPNFGPFAFASDAVGNQDLVEERLDQIEIGYRGSVADGKFSWDVAWYRTETKDNIDFYTAAPYTWADTFFGTLPGLPPLPLPYTCALPGSPTPPCPPGLAGALLLPKLFSYRNIGKVINQGFEIGVRIIPVPRNTLVVNYSYQKEPETEGIPEGEVNIPPENRFNIGWNGYAGDWFYGAVVNHVGEAFWTDVLDSRFWGTTDAYTTLDASFGMMFDRGNGEVSLRGTNLTDEPVLQHIFGDIIGRRIVLEVAFTVR